MMCDMDLIKMTRTDMPVPNPHDWLTIAGAAFLLGVSARTIARMLDAGQLSTFRPLADRPGAGPVMLWRPEVNALLSARLVAAAGPAVVAGMNLPDDGDDPCAGGCSDPAMHAESGHDV